MNLRNYTSEVPAEKSINNIEKILIELKASRISKEYKNGKVIAIAFSIPHGNGVMPFLLPAKVEPVKKFFLTQIKKPSHAQIANAERQAERTAWKNVKEWVDLQATMIKLEQVEFMEVFMPYIYFLEDGKTLFERMKSNDFKQLSS